MKYTVSALLLTLFACGGTELEEGAPLDEPMSTASTSAGVMAPSGSPTPAPTASPSPSPSPSSSPIAWPSPSPVCTQPVGFFGKWMCPKTTVPRNILEEVARDPIKAAAAKTCLEGLASVVGSGGLRDEHWDMCIMAAATGLREYFCSGRDVFMNSCAAMGIGRNSCMMLWLELQVVFCQ